MVTKRYFIYEMMYNELIDPERSHCWVTGEKLDLPSFGDSSLFNAVYDKINNEVQKENPPYRTYNSGGKMFDHEYQMKLKSWTVSPASYGNWRMIEFVFDWYTFPILTKDFWEDVGGVT